MMLSIGEVAEYLGVSVATMRRWHKMGKLAPSWRAGGGHRRYDLSELTNSETPDGEETRGRTVAYARASSHDQKADLERQAERLRRYCIENGWEEAEVIQDLGFGLNYRKKGLNRLLRLICRRQISRLVLQSKDRLLRFGAEIIFALCKAFGIEVVLIDPPQENFEARLAEDVTELMTVFSARLGRGHRDRLPQESRRTFRCGEVRTFRVPEDTREEQYKLRAKAKRAFDKWIAAQIRELRLRHDRILKGLSPGRDSRSRTVSLEDASLIPY